MRNYFKKNAHTKAHQEPSPVSVNIIWTRSKTKTNRKEKKAKIQQHSSNNKTPQPHLTHPKYKDNNNKTPPPHFTHPKYKDNNNK